MMRQASQAQPLSPPKQLEALKTSHRYEQICDHLMFHVVLRFSYALCATMWTLKNCKQGESSDCGGPYLQALLQRVVGRPLGALPFGIVDADADLFVENAL